MGHPCLFFSFAFLQLCDLKKRKLLISTGVHAREMFSFFIDPIKEWLNGFDKIGFNDFVLC